jgi:hypothetical protein
MGSDPEHGLVFTEGMDHDPADALVAGLQGSLLEQTCSVTPAALGRQHRHTKFGAGMADVARCIGDVRHSDQ